MNNLNDPTSGRLATAMVLALTVLTTGVAAAPRGRVLPPFSRIEKTVQRHFLAASDPQKTSEISYRPYDLLSRSRVAPLFVHLRLMGWAVKDERAILAHVLVDHEFLVRQFQASAVRARRGEASPGSRFMRQVNQHPLAYDRLHRITSLTGGRRFLTESYQRSDNQALIVFLTTGKIDDSLERASEVRRLISSAAEDVDFDQPTRRIYTAAQLIAALRVSYDRQRKSRTADPAAR